MGVSGDNIQRGSGRPGAHKRRTQIRPPSTLCLPRPANNNTRPSQQNKRATRSKMALKDVFRSKEKPEYPLRRISEIYKVPRDVLLCVVDKLSPADVAALALTSKTILNALGRQALKIDNNDDRRELLRRLERRYPNHLLCHQCGVFHLRPPRLRNPVLLYSRRCYEIPACDLLSGCFTNFSTALCISFSLVQEVMNRHRYGRKHGLGLRVMRFNEPLYPEHFQTRAKIFRGQLYLIIQENMHTLRTEYNLKKIVTHTHIHYCRHFSSNTIRPFPEYIEHSLAQQKGHKQTVYFQCLECSTFVQLQYRRHSMFSPSSCIKTTAWYRLGPCTDPFDPQWRVLTVDRSPVRHPRMTYVAAEDVSNVPFFNRFIRWV